MVIYRDIFSFIRSTVKNAIHFPVATIVTITNLIVVVYVCGFCGFLCCEADSAAPASLIHQTAGCCLYLSPTVTLDGDTWRRYQRCIFTIVWISFFFYSIITIALIVVYIPTSIHTNIETLRQCRSWTAAKFGTGIESPSTNISIVSFISVQLFSSTIFGVVFLLIVYATTVG